MENTVVYQAKTRYYPRLKALRVSAGLNQTDVAELLDMQQNQYSRYERGERELPMHLFVKLAEVYKVSLDYVAGLTDVRERT